jgi:hypothetical protein
MTTTPSPKTMKRKAYLLTAMLITFVLILIAITTRGGATSFFSASDLTPTAIPPAILTQLASTPITATQMPPTNYFAQVTQAYLATIQAGAAFPTHDNQEIYPIFSRMPRIEDILASKLKGALAGNGILVEDEYNWYGDTDYELDGLIWEEWTYDSELSVRGGHTINSPQQGIVWIQITPHHSGPQSRIIVESPTQMGTLNVTGAVSERLILTSEQGQTFYFDVPALQFVDSLEESLPAATPYPTQTLPPPLAPIDDVSDQPFYVYDTQLEDDDVNHYINSPSDYDWFHFVSQASGRLKISLIPRGKNYGLRVVFIDENDMGTIAGENTTLGGGTKQVSIPNAPSGNYMVRVWSLDGSYDENQPYTVRFEPPKPRKVTPILECVAENPDGTFTAHFGYDNPNPVVILIDANHDNAFHPGPVFRTGQPEYFIPGRVTDWFSVLFDGNGLTWTLDGQAVTANRNSPRCP